jgi:hypothetical protein
MAQTPDRRAYQHEWYLRNREKIRERQALDPEQRRAYKREYYLRNRERLLDRQREYEAQNRDPAKRHEYYLRNRERILEKQRAYNAANPRDPERWREYDRNYKRRARAADPEKYRAYKRARYAQDPEKILAQNRRWAVRNGESMRTWRMRARHGMSPGDWATMYAAQDGRCYLCGDELTEDTAVIEHDHRCCPRNYSCRICRRGLACGGCNVAIGRAQDDPARLRRIADALETAKLLVDQRQAEAGERLTLF